MAARSSVERVRLIYRRYLELGGVNALVRDLRERVSMCMRTV
jgi:hypothetical protein